MKRLIGVLLLLVAGPVGAAPKRVYAIRELRVDGDMTEAERQRLRERAYTAAEMLIGSVGSVVVPAADVDRVLAERPELRRCYDWHCNVTIADQLHATRVVVIRVDRKGAASQPGTWTVAALNFATDALRLVGRKEEECDACVAEDLVKRDVLTRAVTSLIKQEPAELPLCRLKVESQPSEAAITIDKTRLGVTPFDRTVAAGTHTVSVEQRGYAPSQTVIECPRDGSIPIRAKLAPAPQVEIAPSPGPQPPPHTVDRRPLYRRLGFVSVGLAAGSLVGLGVAAGFHNQPSSGCEAGRCTYRYNETPALVLTAVGAAAFGVAAVVLLVKGYAAPARQRTTWIAPTTNGVVVGGTF